MITKVCAIILATPFLGLQFILAQASIACGMVVQFLMGATE
jgi:hypothetical protein